MTVGIDADTDVARLVGAITAAILRDELVADQGAGQQGTGRFALNLNPEQTAAVARAVLADPLLDARIELKLPAAYLDGYGLPASTLTDIPSTWFRNASCPKAAFLISDVEHGEGSSLNEIARLGAPELLERLGVWVRVAAPDLRLPDDQLRMWERALAGLRDLRLVSLDRFASYVLRTRHAVLDDGQPLLYALGAALPALRLPRDDTYFDAIKEKSRHLASAWRSQFATAQKRRAGLLLKQTASQLLLSEEDLASAFGKVKAQMAEDLHPAVEAFIAAPSGWNAAAAGLAECDWEKVEPLFGGLQRERFNLGQGTRDFYAERETTLLTDEDRNYLERLVKRTGEPEEQDAAFYEAHRAELKEDRKLKSAWDRFVFGRPVEHGDFLAGLAAALEPLFNRVQVPGARKLRIRCERATKRDLRDLNAEAGLHFAHRYAGLQRLFDARVTWDVGDLFGFKELVEGWRAARTALNRSASKTANQLRFVLELDTVTPEGGLQSCSAQLVWRYEAGTVASQLADDWARLVRHPMLACRATREFAGGRARAGTIDLSDVRTFVPAYDRDRGSFVPVYRTERDLAAQWRANLARCRAERFLADPTADALSAAFDAFEGLYADALSRFRTSGAANAVNVEQLRAYAALLDGIVTTAKGDRNRELLLKPILQIGVVGVEGGAPAAVVAPWHPMRLAAAWRKTRLLAEIFGRLLASQGLVEDTRLFFRDVEQDLAHPLYPEIVAIWTEDGPRLLATSDAVHGYSLHEPPVAPPGRGDDTNESPTEASACVLDLVQRYLALHPHERSNMSVVLYNCDSARLPEAVVERIGALQDDEEMRCQILLRHADDGRLRHVYRSILATDASVDAFSASESTQDFMARLRISVLTGHAASPDPMDGCPYDIVFSQDVIARHAGIEWHQDRAAPAAIGSLLPSRWSRRRPAASDDLKSSAYLCCPVQSAEGWSYLTALATVFRGDWDSNVDRRLIPVRQLDFTDGRTSRIFRETHDLANWVVNYDQLLDRQQLLNQDVRVIRYKQSATQGRNLIISSNAPLGLLRSMILQRLRALALDLPDADLRKLADMLIGDANDVSGDIVLRAAKRGQSASELIGVVLSRRLVRDQLGFDALAGWYFLDDYAAWMGQREEQLADLLAISPRTDPDGRLKVSLVVSEAKYVEVSSLAPKRKESQKQLRDTMRRVEDAVFGGADRLDRDSWLSRLADLMLEGIRLPASSGIDLGTWRRAMREGWCDIALAGVSHVFVPTGDVDDVTDFSEIPGDVLHAHQEIYGRPALKRLLQAYWRGEDTLALRRSLGAEHLERQPPWRSAAEPPIEIAVKAAAPAIATKPPITGPPDEVSAAPCGDVRIAKPVPQWAYTGIAELILQSVRTAGAAPDGWLSEVSAAARSALQQLGLQAKLINATLTPNSALLRFAGTARLTTEQVFRKRSELLTTFGLNVISVRPEPGALALAIERPVREIVDVASLWSGWSPTPGVWGNKELLIAVREGDGSPLYLAPGKKHAPHTLIAGSTGSGKSVLMQNIILAIAATNTPEQAKIILIDPKQGVDYFLLDALPHIDGGVIDDQTTAAARLEELVVEMDRRYATFKAGKVSDLDAYNAGVPPGKRLPTIWLIHDEFAEWMLTESYREAAALAVQRLGVKARAAGIHLVFAAQRPDVQVMPVQLRDNLGNRLILRVSSEGTSEIALGEKGAERLLGRGHLLAKLEGERDLCFAQVPYVNPAFAKALAALTTS